MAQKEIKLEDYISIENQTGSYYAGVVAYILSYTLIGIKLELSVFTFVLFLIPYTILFFGAAFMAALIFLTLLIASKGVR